MSRESLLSAVFSWTSLGPYELFDSQYGAFPEEDAQHFSRLETNKPSLSGLRTYAVRKLSSESLGVFLVWNEYGDGQLRLDSISVKEPWRGSTVHGFRVGEAASNLLAVNTLEPGIELVLWNTQADVVQIQKDASTVAGSTFTSHMVFTLSEPVKYDEKQVSWAETKRTVREISSSAIVRQIELRPHIKSLAPFKMGLEESIEQLVALGNSLKDQGAASSFLQHNKPVARSLGERILSLGGMTAMRHAHSVVAQRMGPVAARELESCWNGIGNWQA